MSYEYKGYLNTKQQEEGFLTHGEIISLPFGSSRSGIPFSIITLSKVAVQDEPVLNPALMIIIDAQFIADEGSSPFPLSRQRATEGFNAYPQWSERNITYLPDSVKNQEILANYRLFWKGSHEMNSVI